MTKRFRFVSVLAVTMGLVTSAPAVSQSANAASVISPGSAVTAMLNGAKAGGTVPALQSQSLDQGRLVVRVAKKGKRARALHRRRMRARSRSRRRAIRQGIAIGIGIAAIAIIANQTANSSNFRAAMRRCDRTYRSFDWETGTYVDYNGRVRVCPFVRQYF
ncbi:MAG: BA14K family protein [Pseudomonadota bacterium]